MLLWHTLIILAQLVTYAYCDFEFDFQGTNSPFYDTYGSGASFDFTNHTYSTVDPIDTSYGAMFNGENSGCSDSGYTGMNLGTDFTVTMWVYVFEASGDQTLWCRYGEDQHGRLTEHACISLSNDKIEILITNSVGPQDSGYQTKTNTLTSSLKVQNGWNLLTVNFFEDTNGKMSVDAYAMEESSCNSAPEYGFANNVQKDLYVDDSSYFVCLGDSLTQAAGPGGAIAPTGDSFAGIIGSVTMESGYTDSATLQSMISCDASCAGDCVMCPSSSSTCYTTTYPPLELSYDFTKTSPYTWSATESPTYGTGPDFTIAEDWFVATPYFVDNQGLYFHDTSTSLCSASGIAINSKSFSVSCWFKRESTSGTASLVTLQDATTGAVTFDLGIQNNKFDITVNGASKSLSCNYGNDEWVYVVASIKQVDPTTSYVCVTANGCDTCSDVGGAFTDSTNQELCVGENDYVGYVKSINFYELPFTQEESLQSYSQTCTAYNGVSCNNCDTTTQACYSTCAIDEYGSACSACPVACSSCSGPTIFECYACFNDTSLWPTPFQSYVYADTMCNSCGDSYIYTTASMYPEECDDGNYDSMDGCSNICEVEMLYTCTPSFVTIMGPSVCTFYCVSSWNLWSVGAPTYLWDSYKECDDGNNVEDDGCSTLCELNTGWTCTGGDLTTADTCVETCGDGYDYGNYACDDGNYIDGDGCDSTCNIESGWTCQYGIIPLPDICSDYCYPKAMDFGTLACVDANSATLDGCNEYCEVEKGWECTEGDPTTIDQCVEICGDSWDMDQYSCDDGNVDYPWTIYGADGCDWNACTVSSGYDCQDNNNWQRSACNEICGDGIHYGGTYWFYMNANECDDGNQRPGDGCSDDCRTERGWSCSGGPIGMEDVCTEECGDWRHFHHEHCDDGNNVNGDGCSSACIEETGMKCTGGGHHWRDDCQEECGDGRNAGYFNCDDGNVINGDGCSSVCTLESGYQCTGGTVNGPDTCTELCGDGQNLGTVDCDDGNLLNTDGCDDTCAIETGYACTHATNGKDTCSEVCGDGIMLGYFQCDDGNLVNDDGCDSTCTIEICWTCDGLSPTTCSIDPVNAIGIENSTLSINQTVATIYFNNSVILQSGFDIYEALEVTIDGPLAPYNFSWYLSNANFIFDGAETDRFEFVIDYLDSQLLGGYEENLTICISNSSQIKHWYCNKYLSTTPCYTFPLYYGQDIPISYCTSQSTANYALYIAGGQLGLGLLFSLIGYSAGGAWDAIYLLQFANYIPAMTIALPSCANHFFQTFKWTNMEEDSIATWLRYAICTDCCEEIMVPPTYNIYKTGFEQYNVLYNLADMLTCVLLLFGIVPVISIIRLLLPGAVMVQNMDNFIRGRFLIVLVNITYLKVAFLTMLNFQFFEVDRASSAFNSFSSIVFLAYILMVPLYYIAQTAIYSRELKSVKNKLQYAKMLRGEENAENRRVIEDKAKIIRNNFRTKTLFEEYNIESPFQYGYMIIFCGQRLVYAYLLARVYDNQDFQLFLMSAMSALTLTWISVFKPYSYPGRNVVAVANEVAAIYLFSQSGVWARAELFCSMEGREFGILKLYQITPILVSSTSTALTGLIGAQAGIWLIAQCYGLRSNTGKKSPVGQDIEVIPKESTLKDQYKDVRLLVEEEKQRQKGEDEEQSKGKDATTKQNKADDDQIVGLPDPEESQNDRTNGPNSQGDDDDEEEKSESLHSRKDKTEDSRAQTSQEEDDDLSEIDQSESNEQSKNQTSRNKSDMTEEESEDLARDESYNPESSQYDQSKSKAGDSSFGQTDNSRDVPESSFKDKRR